MSWRAIGLVLAVTMLGLVGGAAVAAPEEMLPLARVAGAKLGQAGGVVMADAGSLAAKARTALPEAAQIRALLVGDGSPRRLAMSAASALMLVAGLAALMMHLRSRRTTTESATDSARRPASGRASTGTERPLWRTRSGPIPAVLHPGAVGSPMPLAPKRRKARGPAGSNDVHAMAAAGSSPHDIARATGLPMDAVIMLIAAANAN